MGKAIGVMFMWLMLSVHTVTAAPAPWGLALNMETKECAGYWAGDEFVAYHLPEGWKAYYPTYDADSNSLWSTITTDAGECAFQMRKEEACCMELGYAFVSRNIGEGHMEKLRDREEFQNAMQKHGNNLPVIFFDVLICAGIFTVVGISMRKSKNKKEQHL
ncbi:MAG: hypothetical protein WC819_01095 [Parcubacteria group bacterium]|jgi:hypothetical protein